MRSHSHARLGHKSLAAGTPQLAGQHFLLALQLRHLVRQHQRRERVLRLLRQVQQRALHLLHHRPQTLEGVGGLPAGLQLRLEIVAREHQRPEEPRVALEGSVHRHQPRLLLRA